VPRQTRREVFSALGKPARRLGVLKLSGRAVELSGKLKK
jgi:hypothetical protein